MNLSTWWTPSQPPPEFTTVSGLSATAETVWQSLLGKHRKRLERVATQSSRRDHGANYYKTIYQKRFGATPQRDVTIPHHRCPSSQSSTVERFVHLPSSAQSTPTICDTTPITLCKNSTHGEIECWKAATAPFPNRNESGPLHHFFPVNPEEIQSDASSVLSIISSPLLDLSSEDERDGGVQLTQSNVGNFTIECTDFGDLSDGDGGVTCSAKATAASDNRGSGDVEMKQDDTIVDTAIHAGYKHVPCHQRIDVMNPQILIPAPPIENNPPFKRPQIRLTDDTPFNKSRLNFIDFESFGTNFNVDSIETTPIAGLETGKCASLSVKSHDHTGNKPDTKQCTSSSSRGFRPPLKRKLQPEQSTADVQLKKFDKILDGMRKKDVKKGIRKAHESPKQDNTAEKPCTTTITATSSNLVAVKSLSDDEREHFVSELTGAEEIAMTLVFEDSSSQLRDLASSTKKKGSLKKVCSLAVAYPYKAARETSSLKYASFPLHLKHGELYAWCRAVISDLMSSTARKLCFEAQEMIRVLCAHFGYKRATVITDWLAYDPHIAGWLLDADHPPNTFANVLAICKDLRQKPASPTLSPKQLLCSDLSLLGPAMVQLYHQLSSASLWPLYTSIETPLVSLLAVMGLRGIRVDADMMRRSQNLLKKTLSALEKKAHECVGHPFVINSHPQLRQVLFDELNLKTSITHQKVALTSVGQHKSTGEGVLISVQGQHPLPGIVLDYRQIQKLNSTYIDGMLCFMRDGHIRPSWDQTAAATGRLTSVNPNVQSVPKVATSLKLRSLQASTDLDVGDITEIFAREPFISEEGFSFLSADFRQIELRILAHLSGDQALVEIFNKTDGDIFTQLTALWLGKNSTTVELAERERTKRVIYSIMYGAGKERLADYLKVSTDEAKGITSSFLVMFPGITAFTRKCIQQAKSQGYQTTIFGRRRLFPHIQHSNSQLRAQAERQAINFCVQGSAADLCKAAMLQVERALIDISNSTAKLLVQIHDELLLHVSDTMVPQIAERVKTIMESSDGLCAGFDITLQVPLQVSISTGKSWSHMVALG